MKVINYQRIFALVLSVLLAIGCASNPVTVDTASGTDAMDDLSDFEKGDFSNDTDVDARGTPVAVSVTDELSGVAAAREGQEIVALNAADAAANDLQRSFDLFPPHAKPGHCYARVLTPAAFETTDEEVLIQEASHRIEIIPAEYEWVDEDVVVQEATTQLEVVPAKYETITEQVLVKPESKKIVQIPAEYRLEEKRVLDRPAHTVWKRSAGSADGSLQTKLDNSTGEVVCLVVVRASYKTVEKTVLVEPARTEEIAIPAEYEPITKTVEVEPATTRKIAIPEKTMVVKQQRLVKAAEEQKIDIPASYETVIRRSKISEESLDWQEVLCQGNMSNDVVAGIQQKLTEQGYNSGGVDGQLGKNTLQAVNAYAKAKDLPLGKNYIAIETVESLGVSY